MLSRVLICTVLGSKCWRCTVCAANSRSLKGRLKRASTSSTPQSWRRSSAIGVEVASAAAQQLDIFFTLFMEFGPARAGGILARVFPLTDELSIENAHAT